ncbi:MAG: cytochrome c oxidase subunit 4 [Candidatus Aldehydirespiratoraceae bacterium]|jgi:cytochrome c oxidase subunit 4
MEVDAPQTPEIDVVHSDVDAAAGLTGSDSGGHGAHEALSDNRYIVIAAILAIVTAAEVAASYIELGPAFIPLLLFMMAFKFYVVVSFFMHLRFDHKVFSFMFYIGLFMALFVYIAALSTFRFWNS